MDRIYINKLNRDFNLELCKVNRDVIGVIPEKSLNSIKRSILDIDSLDISIKKYIHQHGKRIMNPLWYTMKEERLVCLNSNEYFVLKTNSFGSSENTKSFIAYSLEYKLSKIDVKFEDIAIMLISSDESNDIYSLNDLLKKDTGWTLGHIDDSVLYNISSDGTKTEKLRWQESVNKRWYDYIKTDICEAFGCIAHYDTLNKKINLYDIKSYGENIELYLSQDNYIKDLERVGSSEDIVTRLYLVGREEMDIVGATVTGYPYIENYSYFMDNDEMSEDLLNQLNKYYDMIAIRETTWRELINTKLERTELLYKKKTELNTIYSEINAKKSVKESYDANKDDINSAIIAAQITKLIDDKVILEVEVRNLENEIISLNLSINNINTLCKRETATDENGYLIFNENTLNELLEFVYCDTYTNDAFDDVNDLIETGIRELGFKCCPKTSYKLDLEPFVTRVKSNGFNKHWKGDLGLGDIIILYDEDESKEVLLYVNSYTQYPNSKDDENELDIEISNMKLSDSNIRAIGDKLKEGNLSMKMLGRKVHLLNKQKYNRINLTKEQIGGTI